MHIPSGRRGRGRGKGLNFELNLVPFIDVLSVCICFLLVTAVFINLGSLHVNQAVGSESQVENREQGSLNVHVSDNGDVRFEPVKVRGFRSGSVRESINGVRSGGVDLSSTAKWISAFASRHPDIKTVLVMPSPSSRYEDLVELMAQFKKVSMDQIGMAPL